MNLNLNSQKLHGQLSLESLTDKSTQPDTDSTLLTELHACFNFITHISPTTLVYAKLTVLSLVCNSLTEVPCLQFCPNLIELNLNNNSISELRHFNFTPKLTALSVSSNRIVILGGLFELYQLQKLVLSGNRLASIELTTLPKSLNNLTHLGLLDNKLASLKNVEEFLSLLPNLLQLSIGLNPLTEYNMLSTQYLLTNLKVPRADIFAKSDSAKEDLTESDRMLRMRQRILGICTKLTFLDLSPISSD